MPHTNEVADDEVNHFFNIEIGISEATIVKFREEDNEILEYLVEFNAKHINSIDEALRKPVGLVPLGSGAIASLTSVPGVQIGAKSLILLEAAMHVMKHYEIVNHKPKTSHLRYDLVVKNFKLEFNAITRCKKKEV